MFFGLVGAVFGRFSDDVWNILRELVGRYLEHVCRIWGRFLECIWDIFLGIGGVNFFFRVR